MLVRQRQTCWIGMLKCMNFARFDQNMPEMDQIPQRQCHFKVPQNPSKLIY